MTTKMRRKNHTSGAFFVYEKKPLVFFKNVLVFFKNVLVFFEKQKAFSAVRYAMC